jgi:hypothetical protein
MEDDGLESSRPGTCYPRAVDLVEALFEMVEALRDEGESVLVLDLLLVDDNLHGVLEGRAIQVVSREGLRALERLAGRPQDLADLARLDELDDRADGGADS